MRRRTLQPLLLSALLACASSACDERAKENGAASAELDGLLHPGTKGLVVQNPFGNRPNFFDFGGVTYGAEARHVFRVKNEEPADVAIHDALPSCGCLRPIVQYTDAKGELVVGSPHAQPLITIPAGATFDVVCEVDTTFIERMNIDKLVQVRLRTSSPTVPYIAFELHIVVERDFRAAPSVFELGEIAQSAGKSARSDVLADPASGPQRILRVERVEGPFDASADETSVNGQRFWMVNAATRPGLELGPVRGKVVLATSGKDGEGEGQPFEIPIHGTVVPDVVAHPGIFAFGSFPVGTLKSCTITLDAAAENERFAFLGAEVKGTGAERMKLVRTPKDSDESGRARAWTIELTAATDFPFGAFSGTVEIRTDHARVPQVRVPYTGNAQ